MIRIDEVYDTLFWPYIEQKLPATRMFYCFPHGRTDPGSLLNHRDSPYDKHYTFFHDQEPIHLDVHRSLFESVISRNADVRHSQGAVVKALIHSEKNSEAVDQVCSLYGWQPYYYFFHGWACLDWFRGYDRTFLIDRAGDRKPTRTFMSPNRIVAGKRDHRVLFLYNVFKNQLDHNHITAPRTCAYENVDISVVASKYCNTYPDIMQVFEQADLPKLFAGEDTQIMTSCWLGNYAEAADSLIYVPTETVYFGDRLHLTEKTFKAIALEMPFVLVAPAGSLAYLREYGFETFDEIFDESYDLETDDVKRIEAVTRLLKDLDNLSVAERNNIHQACLPIVEHNYNHFYRGGFESSLWAELTDMLDKF
jgi:hypothetical protein